MSEYIQRGDSGEAVTEVQHLLRSLNFYAGELNGFFDEYVEHAVAAYRAWRGYPEGGYLDADSLAMLRFDAHDHADSTASDDNPYEDPYDDEAAPATPADPNQSIRESALALAMGEIGLVRAKDSSGDDDDGRPLRYGWERLKEYFDVAAPGVWSDDVVKYVQDGLPSWCGIFALWALKSAGASVGTWQMGSGIPGAKYTNHPQPGDIGYIDKNQHHCLVIRVDGDTVYSIDGNTVGDDTGGGEVNDRTRSKKEYAAFLTVFD